MLIQPVEQVLVTIKIGEEQFAYHLISLSDNELELTGFDYLEKETPVLFFAKYFRGEGVVHEIKFDKSHFTYKLNIIKIQFQPGLIINTRL